jgi:hypothetical protein
VFLLPQPVLEWVLPQELARELQAQRREPELGLQPLAASWE